MQTVKVIIEKTKDMYSVYAGNVEGVSGGGETVDEARQSIIDAIRLLKEYNTPKILKGEYQVIYKFDMQNFA